MTIATMILAAAVVALLGLCYCELRTIRHGLDALDESARRRAAVMVGELNALRARGREPAPPAPAGLRLPGANVEEHDSEGETRVMRQPTAAELAAQGAVPPCRRGGAAAAGS